MKLAAAVALFASAVCGAQTSASAEPNQACVKACQVAPEDQRETCMRVCSQFAEQGINFAPASASASTHSSAPAIKQTAPALASSPAKSNSAISKPTESPAATSSGASAMASGSMSTAAKSQGEESAEDHSSVSAKSMSVANSGPHTVGARLGASVLVLAAVALF
ncbi:hypothetical protein IW152_000508 [Coemansia sp. BCRC 34962]|nr:hypothetical protein IW152_000508 [Coemansia sp. BCRC 34962]